MAGRVESCSIRTFPDAIDAAASAHRERIALLEDPSGASISYGELAQQSRFAAQGLVAAGVIAQSSRPVATYMRRGCDWYVVYVAAARLGTPLAGLSTEGHLQQSSVADRHARLLDMQPQLLVYDDAAADTQKGLPAWRLLELLDAADSKPLSAGVPQPDDLLCYCFTGGTTGRQRCVPVTHRMAAHEVNVYPEALGLLPTQEEAFSVLQPSPLHWAAAVYGQLDVAVAFHGCAVVTEAIDVQDLAAVVRNRDVSVMGLPPSMIALLSPSDFTDFRKRYGSCRLRRIISWGESCPVAVAELWGAKHLPWRFLDVLISTEYWLSLVARERDPADGRCLFKPVTGIDCFVRRLEETCDVSKADTSSEAQEGDYGELCIGGDAVCSGLEEKVFLRLGGRRFYRSGDLVLRKPGGYLSFAGRGDDLVKVFGQWVDLAEVARQIAGLPGVQEAAAVTGGPEEHRAVAVLRPGQEPAAFAAAAAASGALPSGGGVLLHTFVDVPLPRNAATRKVDRVELLRLLRSSSSSQAPKVEVAALALSSARPAAEALLASVGEVLGIPVPVSPESSFIALGGDSAAAVRLASAAARRGLKLRALDILRAPSLSSLLHESIEAQEPREPLQKRLRQGPADDDLIAQRRGYWTRLMAVWCRSASSSATAAAASLGWSLEELHEEVAEQIGVPSRAVEDIRLCTPFQDLLLSALDAANGSRKTPGTLQTCVLLGPNVDAQRLRAAWQASLRACPALRSGFVRVEGRYVQTSLRPSWSRDTFREAQLPDSVEGGSFRKKVRALMNEDAALGFESKGPHLCRLLLVRLRDEPEAPAASLLLLTTHNAACDGWSCNLLLHDILRSTVNGAVVPARPLCNEEWMDEGKESLADLWRDAFADFRPPTSATATAALALPLNCAPRRLAVDWQLLGARAAAMQATPAALLLSAFALVWARRTCRRDFAFGAVLSGREEEGGKALGCLLSLLPLRLKLLDDWQTLEGLVGEVQRGLLNLLDINSQSKGCASMSEIRSWARLPRDQPVFDCAWIFENAPAVPEDLAEKAGYELFCERELTPAGDAADAPELRLSRRNGSCWASLRGCLRLPGSTEGAQASAEGCEGSLLLAEFDAVLSVLVTPSQGADSHAATVGDLLRALPLLPEMQQRVALRSSLTELPEESSEDLKDLQDFWCPRLPSTMEAALELPTVLARGSVNSKPSWKSLTWSARSPARDASAMVLASWAAVLSQASGQDEVYVGMPLTSSKKSGELATCAGNALPLLNSAHVYPIRCSLTGSKDLKSVAEDIELQISEASLRAQYSRTSLERFANVSPWTPRLVFGWGAAGAEILSSAKGALPASRDLAGVEMLLLASPVEESHRLNGALVWDAAAGLGQEQVERLLLRLTSTLARLASCSEPHTQPWQTMLSRPAERRSLLHERGVSQSAPLPEAGVLQLLLQQARRTPHSAAIASGEGAGASPIALSYADLVASAAATCDRLQLDVPSASSEAAVGVLSERSPTAIVGLVAVLLAGAAYCPLLPSQPKERLVTMAAIAGLVAVVVEEALLGLAGLLDLPAVAICCSRSCDLQRPGHIASTQRRSSAAMHVLFTSGSTGTPKAVRASEQAVLSHLLQLIQSSKLQPTDVGLQHTSLAWVAAMPEVWAPLISGATLAVAPSSAGAKDLETLAAFAANGCSFQQYVPSVLEAMLHAGLKPVSTACRHLVLTGEPLSTSLCKRLLDSQPSVQLRNHYGQTEAADTTTVFVVQRPLPHAAAIPIGRPAIHRQVWLGSPSCLGDVGEGGGPGELLVAGPGLLIGQASNSGALQESALGAGVALCTGDLARWVWQEGAEDPDLVCLGRRDRQVKIRGHRVELAEVEAVLKEEAERVLGRPVEALALLANSHGRQQLVAYVRPPELASGSMGKDLLAACRSRLLAHAAPVAVVGVAEWPRAPGGKLDRKALPPPQLAGFEAEASPSVTAPVGQCLAQPPRASDTKLRAKGWQVLRALLAGALAGRCRIWRMLLLPFVWVAWAGGIAPRSAAARRRLANAADEQSPWLLSLVTSALLPNAAYVSSAAFGVWRLGLRRSLAMPVLWWLGLSHVDSQLLAELTWYGWYLTPGRSLGLARVMLQRGSETLSSVTGTRQKRTIDWDWDRPQRRPRRRPRLDSVRVQEEPQGRENDLACSSAAKVVREELTREQQQLLRAVEEEAGSSLELAASLASVFDSLRLTALVAELRRSGAAPEITLRHALSCDTVADLIAHASAGQSTTGAAQPSSATCRSPGRSTPRFFKVREWRYMFRLSVCWALEAKTSVDLAALKRALRRLRLRHAALAAQLADPAQLWDFAMEAAGNLSLLRSLLLQQRQAATRRGRARSAGLLPRTLNSLGNALHRAWPRLVVHHEEQEAEVPLHVVACSSCEQMEQRSAWLLDGRNGRHFSEGPFHAVLLQLPAQSTLPASAEEGPGSRAQEAEVPVASRLHLAVSHGLCDGFSGTPLLQDFVRLYESERGRARRSSDGSGDDAAAEDMPSTAGLELLESRLAGSLGGGDDTSGTADMSSWALPCAGMEGFDHFVWLHESTLLTLQKVVERSCWYCSLDVALLAVLGTALARMAQHGPLSLRFTASARDGSGEGLMVADLADYRDLDMAFGESVAVEEAARALASCVRQRRWQLPSPLTDGEERVYLNFRPLLQEEIGNGPSSSSSSAATGASWKYRTLWPPVEGEWGWERRNLYHSLWIMADQVAPMEWVLCLKVRWDRPGDAQLGEVVESVVRDLALRPSAPLRSASQSEAPT